MTDGPPRAATAGPAGQGDGAPEALLARLTLEEKVALLHQHAPGVERLGLAGFRTGTEALHGVAWLGPATVFPQPVGLGATWDPALVRRVAGAVATEVRAKRAADPAVGLNVWAPVANPLRHPLWGRNEEGFSEDPDLTAELATAYATGLRGAHPRVWKTVPTLKHLLGYGHETDRTVGSAHLPPQALREYELPAYDGPLRSGAVGAAMASYNLVNGRPSHVSQELLDELRSWAPSGALVVVSDAQAPSNLVDDQRYFDDHVRAHAAALRAGVDSFTDNGADRGPTTERLRAALERGLVTEADVEAAVLRLLRMRALTGELTGEDPYAVAATDVDTAEHRSLAREAAGRSVVVLANERHALPLRAPRSIAVVGPFADRVATDWYSGTPTDTWSVARALAARYPDTRLAVVPGADLVTLRSLTTGRYLRATPDGAAVTADGLEPDGDAVFEVTDWGVLTLRSAASGRLLTATGERVTADAERVGGWVVQESFRARGDADGGTSLLHLGSRSWLRVRADGAFGLATGASSAAAERFELRVVRSGVDDVRAACADADVVVVAVGNEPHLLGREAEDRPGLELPAPARELWAAASAAASGATVLLIVSSYPYALDDRAMSAGAIVWTCHGGQELGRGVVDVLSGDREPSGRLPQTWWARSRDAGELFEYDVVQHAMTYRYSTATPLFGLGHGLTYGRVEYLGIDIDPRRVAAPAATRRHTPARGTAAGEGPGPRVTVTVRNSGDRVAHELVAVYALALELPVPAPRVRLAGYARVALDPGECREVVVRCPAGVLAVWDVAADPDGAPDGSATPGAYRVQPGAYRLASGPSAARLTVSAPVRVTGDAPAPRRLTELPAHAFHASRSVTTSDLTRERGSCVEVATGAGEGWVRYDGLDLSGTTRLALTVARRSLPAREPARLAVETRPSSAGAAPWTPLCRTVDVPEGLTCYAWTDVEVDVASSPPGPVDLRVRLHGASRLARLASR